MSKTPVRLHLIGLHALNDPVFIGKLPITLVFLVPKVKHLGRHEAILSLDTEVAESKNQVGVFVTPALKSLVEAVDLQKILTPDTEIAASNAAPCETLFYPE